MPWRRSPSAKLRLTGWSVRCRLPIGRSTTRHIRAAETAEVAPGIILDYDEAGTVIGIEVLDILSRLILGVPVAAE